MSSERGVSIPFDFSPGGEIITRLQTLAATDLDRVKRRIGSYMLGEIQDRFDGQTLWDGTPMTQSAAARARGGKTLIDRHHLYDSYTYQVTDDGVEIGSDLIYARIHHFGGQTGRGGKTLIEPRPVLGVNDDDARVIGDMLIQAIGG